jgi:hypothetical protein
MGRACRMRVRDEKCTENFRILAGRPYGKGPFGRPRRRREDNIRINLREIQWEVVNWIHLSHGSEQWRAFLKIRVD